MIAPLTGLITPRTGNRPVIVVGCAMMASSLAWLAGVLAPTVSYAALVAPFAVAGVGMGLIFAPIAAATLERVAPQDQATASGTNSTARELGVALGIATLTAVFTANGGELSPEGYTDAAVPALLTGSGALLLAAVGGFWLPALSDPARSAGSRGSGRDVR